MKLEGKVAIVTGAAQGIGAEYARALAGEGARVVAADIKEELCHALAAELRDRGHECLPLYVDVGDPESAGAMAQKAAATYGGIDILVNNAAIFGGMMRTTLTEVPLDYLKRFMEVNLYGALYCVRAVLPFMKERGKGKIINQASIAAYEARGLYGLAKLGMVGLTTNLAVELGQYHVNVNAIAPGAINTAATMSMMSEEFTQDLLKRMAFKRLGTPRDLLGTLIFLASDDSDWITGQTLVVDGGTITRL